MLNTYGFDTIYALRISKINEGIADSPTAVPQIFQEDSGSATTLAAKSTTWKFLVRDGAVFATFHLMDAVLRRADDIVDVSGSTVEVEVSLASLPGQVPGTARAAFTIAGKSGVVPKVVVQAPGRAKTSESMLQSLIQAFLTNHAGEISFDFLLLSPPAGATDTWLQPTAVQFALGKDEGQDRTALLVCAALRGTGPAAPPSGVLQVPSAWNGFFLLSPEVVMRHLVAPSLAGAYGLSPNAFLWIHPGLLVWSGSIDLPGQKVGAITYYPKIESIVSSISGPGILITQASGTCDLGAGIHLKFTVTTRNPFQFNVAQQSMSFLHDPNPPQTTHSDVPTWLSIVSAGLADSIVSIIALEFGKKLSAFAQQNIALTNIPGFVQWSGLPNAKIAAAALDGTLLLEGSF